MKKILTVILSMVAALAVCGAAACTAKNKTEKLSAPVIELNGNVVSWQTVENAASYNVYVADEAAVSVTETSYTLTQTEVGSYEVYVTAVASEGYSDSDASNKVTYVIEKPAVFTSLKIVSPPDKETYYLDERASAPDLTGLRVKVVYDNGAEADADNSAFAIGAVNLTEPGEKKITLSYTVKGITKETSFNVDVKERTLSDLKNGEYTTVNNEYSASATEYKIADGAVTAIDMNGNEVDVTVKGGATYISASAFNKPSAILLRVTDGEKTTFIKVAAATYISTAEDFAKINEDLDGYYVLTKDLYWENDGTMIGKAGITSNVIADETVNTLDLTGEGNSAGQKGEAFTGTFDGNGYVLHGFDIKYDKDGSVAAWQAPAFYMGVFGWIGESGRVCNFTLRSCSIRSGKLGAFIAGVNQGVIENVVIEGDSKLYVNYLECGAIAAYNDGKINNVLCYADKMTDRNGEHALSEAVFEGNGKNDAVNTYIANKTDLTDTLGEGWFYIENHGTVYGNDSYAIVLSCDSVWYIGRNAHIEIYQRGKADISFQTWGLDATGVDGSETIKFVSYDEETRIYTVTFNPAITNENLAAGTQFNLGVKLDGYDYMATISVTVGSRFVTQATAEAFTLPEGVEINLSEVVLTLTYSDGSTGTITPVRFEGYDKNGEVGVVQTVKFFYGENADEYAEVSVTPVAKQVSSISVAENSTHKTSFTVGESFTYEGLTIEVVYDNGSKEIITADALTVDDSNFNTSSAGSYAVKVSYGGKECVYNVTVASAAVSSLSLSGTPAKTSYKIGESVTVADLSGLTATAIYSDGSSLPVEITLSMLSYDFSSTGTKRITVTYQGKSAYIEVSVEDYVTQLSVALKGENKKVEYSSEALPDFGSVCTFTATMKSGATQTLTTGVTASGVKAGLNKVKFTCGEAEVTPDIEFEIWYIINSVSDWNKINENLSGYYKLGDDLDFNFDATAIGVSPLCVASEETYIDNGQIAGSVSTREGKAFTGIFDGAGHKLIRFKVVGYESGYNADFMGMAPFMFVGEGGKITDFTVSNANLSVCNFGSLAVCYNKGEVDKIIIEAGSVLNSNWGASSAVVTLNEGTVKDCVSYVTTYNVLFNSTVGELPLVSQNNGTLQNNFGLSCKISTDGTVKADVYYYNDQGDYEPSFWTWGVPNYNDGENNGNALTVAWAGYSAASGSYHWTLTLKADSGLSAGDTFNVGVKINGGGYLVTYPLTVTGEQSVAYCL